MVTEPIIELAEEICRAVPCARAGALHLHRLRGHLLRAAGRAHRAAARQDPQVRGRLPRRARLLDDVVHPALAEGVPGAGAGLVRHPARPRRPGADRALQRSRHRRGHRGDPRRRAGRGDHRAVPAADPAPARVPAGPAGDHPAPRHPAHLRRGGDRLPPRLRRRPGVLRRGAGHRLRRQDRGRRLPARRGVRLRRADAALRPGRRTARATSSRSPARSTATRSPRSRGSPRSPSCASRAPTSACTGPAGG